MPILEESPADRAPGHASGRRSSSPPLTELRRIGGPVVLVGLASGAAGFVYLWILGRLEQVFWPGGGHLGRQALFLIGAGLVAALLTRWLGDPGGVDLMVDNIHVEGGPRDIRALRSLLPISLIGIAVGGAAGPEAPLVQTTGSIGTWLAARMRLSQTDRRTLTITGMAAGFTVLFGAPLGAAIFALEILHRRGLEYYEALLPAIVGSLFGYGVYVVATGLDLIPVWHFETLGALRLADLGWGALAGLAGGLVAAGFIALHERLHRLLGRLPRWSRPALGGAGLALVACLSPFALTFGEGQISEILIREPLVSLLVVAALAKLAGTLLTIASGWKGGFIIPLFFIGATLGRLWHVLDPATNELVMMAALMAAINTGVTKTPIGSTLVVTGMTGLRLVPTTMLAAVLSLMLTSRVGMIESQRSRIREAAEASGA